MDDCSSAFEVLGQTSWYCLLLDTVSAFSILINVTVIYCIIHRSPKTMQRYKWFLLYHQCITFFTDIMFNLIGRPVILLPYFMGYPASPIWNIIPTRILTNFCGSCIIFSLTTVEHLFMFRYLTIKGHNYFPLQYKFRISLTYCLVFALSIQIERSCFREEYEVVEEMATKYQCVTKDLLRIPGFVVFDESNLLYYVGPVAILWGLLGFVESLYFVFQSLRLTTTKNMSKELAKLHRKFLWQLLMQVSLPFGIVCIPVACYLLVIVLKINGTTALGHLIIATVSSFSWIEGIILLFLNPSYTPFLNKFRNRQVSTAMVSQQTRSRGDSAAPIE